MFFLIFCKLLEQLEQYLVFILDGLCVPQDTRAHSQPSTSVCEKMDPHTVQSVSNKFEYYY